MKLNVIKNTLAPYAFWFKVAGIAAVLFVAFVGGCSVGKNKGLQDRHDLETTNTALALQVQTLRVENDGYLTAMGEANKNAEANKKFAEERQKMAEDAAKKLEKYQEEQAKKQAKNEAELRNALKDPKCAELMKLKVCSAIPRP